MSAVVLTVIAVWLVLSALATVACTLITRGGVREDDRRVSLDSELARLLDGEDDAEPTLPWPRVPTG